MTSKRPSHFALLSFDCFFTLLIEKQVVVLVVFTYHELVHEDFVSGHILFNNLFMIYAKIKTKEVESSDEFYIFNTVAYHQLMCQNFCIHSKTNFIPFLFAYMFII